MASQEGFTKFHKFRINFGTDGLNHPFVDGNDIYLHATTLENLDGILTNGLMVQNSQLGGTIYLHKSWKECATYVINKNPDYAMIAVDLSGFDPKLYRNDPNDLNLVRAIASIGPDHIVGYIIVK